MINSSFRDHHLVIALLPYSSCVRKKTVKIETIWRSLKRKWNKHQTFGSNGWWKYFLTFSRSMTIAFSFYPITFQQFHDWVRKFSTNFLHEWWKCLLECIQTKRVSVTAHRQTPYIASEPRHLNCNVIIRLITISIPNQMITSQFDIGYFVRVIKRNYTNPSCDLSLFWSSTSLTYLRWFWYSVKCDLRLRVPSFFKKRTISMRISVVDSSLCSSAGYRWWLQFVMITVLCITYQTPSLHL